MALGRPRKCQGAGARGRALLAPGSLIRVEGGLWVEIARLGVDVTLLVVEAARLMVEAVVLSSSISASSSLLITQLPEGGFLSGVGVTIMGFAVVF